MLLSQRQRCRARLKHAIVASTGFILATALPLPSLARTQRATTEDGVRHVIQSFCDSLTRGEREEAFDSLFASSELIKSRSRDIGALKDQALKALDLYGKVLGCEIIQREQFGDSIARYVSVVKLERHPLVWEFFFYRSGGPWLLAGVKFNDEFKLPCK